MMPGGIIPERDCLPASVNHHGGSGANRQVRGRDPAEPGAFAASISRPYKRLHASQHTSLLQRNARYRAPDMPGKVPERIIPALPKPAMSPTDGRHDA
jgi:hypothetical protein